MYERELLFSREIMITWTEVSFTQILAVKRYVSQIYATIPLRMEKTTDFFFRIIDEA
jgi:hypothetical protein